MDKSGSSSGDIWVFFDREKDKKHLPVSRDQAQMFILGLKVKDLGRFAIWTPGWNSWQRLDKYLKTSQKYFVVSPQVPAKLVKKSEATSPSKIDTQILTGFTEVSFSKPPPHKEWIAGTEQDFRAEFINIAATPIAIGSTERASHQNPDFVPFREQRRHPRHDVKINVILITAKGQMFRTLSNNISLSGTQLMDPIPPHFLRQNFDLVVINPLEKNPQANKIIFQSRIVGSLSDARNLTFLDPTMDSIAKLQKLLQSYINNKAS